MNMREEENLANLDPNPQVTESAEEKATKDIAQALLNPQKAAFDRVYFQVFSGSALKAIAEWPKRCGELEAIPLEEWLGEAIDSEEKKAQAEKIKVSVIDTKWAERVKQLMSKREGYRERFSALQEYFQTAIESKDTEGSVYHNAPLFFDEAALRFDIGYPLKDLLILFPDIFSPRHVFSSFFKVSSAEQFQKEFGVVAELEDLKADAEIKAEVLPQEGINPQPVDGIKPDIKLDPQPSSEVAGGNAPSLDDIKVRGLEVTPVLNPLPHVNETQAPLIAELNLTVPEKKEGSTETLQSFSQTSLSEEFKDVAIGGPSTPSLLELQRPAVKGPGCFSMFKIEVSPSSVQKREESPEEINLKKLQNAIDKATCAYIDYAKKNAGYSVVHKHGPSGTDDALAFQRKLSFITRYDIAKKELRFHLSNPNVRGNKTSHSYKTYLLYMLNEEFYPQPKSSPKSEKEISAELKVIANKYQHYLDTLLPAPSDASTKPSFPF